MDISNKGEDQTVMASRKYIQWQDEGVEKEDIQAVADMINAMQKAQYNNHRHCYTGARKTPATRLLQLLTLVQAPTLGRKDLSKGS